MHLMRCDGDIAKMVVKKGLVDMRNSSFAQRPEEDVRISKSSSHFFEMERLGDAGNALREHIMRERALYNARTAWDNSWAWVSTHSRDCSNHSLERDWWEKEDRSSSSFSVDERMVKFPVSPPASPLAGRQRQEKDHTSSREHTKSSNGTLRQLLKSERTTLKGLIRQDKSRRLQVAPTSGRRCAV